MKAVVTGLLAAYPVGGVFWDYAQYALGLERLGLDVWYLEDTDMPVYDLDARDYDYEGGWDAAAALLHQRLAAVSPTLADRWHLRGDDGLAHGVPSDDMAEIVAGADVFLNVSGAAVLRDEYLANRCKVFVDTDPGWNHFMRFPKADAEHEPVDHGYRAHDHFFTYAERYGRPGCRIPGLGLDWRPTRPPLVADLWAGAGPTAADAAWTTVLSWDNSPHVPGEGVPRPICDGERSYGTKEIEFLAVEDLPGMVDVPLEIAAGGANPPVEHWRERGWSVRDSIEVSRTPERYRDYLQRSRGEFSVAKNVYVATGSGWFSCRSVCYLASGRPVVVQDTGFSELVPTGDGILAFTGAREAAAALTDAASRYDHHAAAAVEVAREQFDAVEVLGALLDHAGVNG